MTERTPLQRLADTGAFTAVDDEGNVTYDTARLVRAVENDPALLDDIAAVFGDEAAEEISAVARKVAEHEEGSWISRWWRCSVAFAGAIGIAWAIWLATDHWPIIYTSRVLWRFVVKLIL